jgi:hypothetical protein
MSKASGLVVETPINRDGVTVEGDPPSEEEEET